MELIVSTSDIERLWRPLSSEEKARAAELIPIVESMLSFEAEKVGKSFENMACHTKYRNVAISVVVDVIARTLMTSTDQEPMTQMTQSAGGYSVSGTFLVPGGGIHIKKSELARLGFVRKQKVGVIDFYEDRYYGHPCFGVPDRPEGHR